MKEAKETKDQQELLDSTVKENWLARIGVQKPYTVFVCIMAILILGVFALTTLKTELFPKMNLPYAIVMLTPDQDYLSAEHMSAAALIEDLSDEYPTLLNINSQTATRMEVLAEIITTEYHIELQDIGLGTVSDDNKKIYANNIDTFARTVLSAGEDWKGLTIEEQDAKIKAMVDGLKAVNLNTPSAAEIAQIAAVLRLYWTTEWTADYMSAKLEELAPANVMAALSTKMQSSLEQVSGKKQIQSMSMSGVSMIIMEYQASATVDPTALLLAIENSNLLNKPEVYGLKYNKGIMQLDPSAMPVYSFTVQGKTNDWYERTLLPRLRSTIGVADVSSKFDSQTRTDMAWVGDGSAEFPETVSFTIQRSTDVATTDAVANIVAALNDLGLEKDTDYIEVLNQGEYITDTIGSVGENLIVGGILAILILFLFLRSVKMTIAIAISIPLAVIATFVAMYFAGIGLNIVSMSALALAVGMLVDNSVIVLENIFRLRQKGLSIRDSAIRGASQIMGAMVASTLTTICVFFPMFFLDGLIMSVFMDLVWVIIFSLSCSLLVAVMFLPGIISSFHISPKVQKEQTKPAGKFKQFFIKFGSGVKAGYDKALHFSISKKWGAVGLAIAIFIGSAALLFINGWELMPSTDEGEFSATVSITPEYTDDVDKEELAKDIYKVVSDRLGVDLDTCMVEYSGGGSIMSVMGGGSGDGMSISIRLNANRDITTDRAAQEVANALQDLITQNDDYEYYGMLGTEVDYSSSSMTSGMVADNVTVRLTSPDADPQVANDKFANEELGGNGLNDAVLAALNKTKIAGVYSTESNWSPNTITQVDKRVVVTYTMKITDGAKINDVQSAVDKAVADLLATDTFKGIETYNDGFAEQMQETYSSLGIAIAVGLILVYLVMVMVFQSFLMPLIVLICIPLAFTGAFIGLSICGMPLSVPALIGFLVLMGVIVNNGILAVDYTNQARRDGLNVRDALVAAMHTRMRPIFMTALTTVIGLIPMALNLSIIGESMGGAMMQPLAVVAIGGLLFGTLTTLLVVPAFYAIFVRDDSIGKKKAVAEAAVTDGGSAKTAEKEDFVRVRGKKINKAKKEEKQHINDGELLGTQQ